MRALERFLIAFVVIAIVLRLSHSATAPVFLILGFAALALYYLVVFPFLKRTSRADTLNIPAQLWQRTVARVLSGAALAYSLLGLTAYALGWIRREDILGNTCVVLAMLLVGHVAGYQKTKAAFSLQTIIRAGILLIVVLALAVLLPDFRYAGH